MKKKDMYRHTEFFSMTDKELDNDVEEYCPKVKKYIDQMKEKYPESFDFQLIKLRFHKKGYLLFRIK